MAVLRAEAKYPVQEWEFRASKSDDIWKVGLHSDHRFSCTCPGFMFGNKHHCKHTQSKRSELESLYGNIHNYLEMLKERSQNKN